MKCLFYSRADPMSNLKVDFSSAEDAADFCFKNGLYLKKTLVFNI